MEILKEWYNLIDKSTWPKGPWNEEPDLVNLRIREYYCQIIRTDFGVLNGYVALWKGHKEYGKGYNSIDIDVHGGLSFSEQANSPELGDIYCDPLDEFHEGPHWYIGFDCIHWMDDAPGMISSTKLTPNSTYKNITFVKSELESLVQQLEELNKNTKL